MRLRHPGEGRDPVFAIDLPRRREDRLTSLCGLSALPGGQSLSLACPRESNQREGHPRGRGLSGIHARATTQAGCGGSLTVRPCTGSERARILRAPLRAFSSTRLPRPRGTREEQSAAVPAAEATAAYLALLLLTLGPSVTRRRADGSGPRPARVRARDRAHSAAVHGWTVSGTPAARSAPPRSAGAEHEGAFLLVTSLWASTAPQERRERRSRPEGRRAGCPE